MESLTAMITDHPIQSTRRKGAIPNNETMPISWWTYRLLGQHAHWLPSLKNRKLTKKHRIFQLLWYWTLGVLTKFRGRNAVKNWTIFFPRSINVLANESDDKVRAGRVPGRQAAGLADRLLVANIGGEFKKSLRRRSSSGPHRICKGIFALVCPAIYLSIHPFVRSSIHPSGRRQATQSSSRSASNPFDCC